MNLLTYPVVQLTNGWF